MSFIVQCFASKQSLTEGAPCRVALLMQGRTYTPAMLAMPDKTIPPVAIYAPKNGPGPDGNWEPLGGFLEAVAGDYGDHELLDTPNNRLLLTQLFRSMASRCAIAQLGENSSHDLAFNMQSILAEHAPVFWANIEATARHVGLAMITWEEASKVWQELHIFFHKGRVFMGDWAHVLRPIKIGVLHECAYQWLLQKGENTLRNGTALSRDLYLPAELQRGLTAFNDNPELQAAMLEGNVSTVIRDALRFIGEDGFRDVPTSGIVRVALADHLKNGKSIVDAFVAPLKHVLDDQYVLRGLDLCQITLEPQHYASQDYQNEAGTLYAQFVKETAENVNKATEKRYNDF